MKTGTQLEKVLHPEGLGKKNNIICLLSNKVPFTSSFSG